MSEKPNEKKETGIVTAKDAAATAAAASAAAGSALLVPPGSAQSVLAVAGVLVALFPPILAAMTEAGVRRMRARGDHYLQTVIDEWARDENKTHEEVAGLLEAHKDDPAVSDAVWRAIRGLMDAPNDGAAVPLGVLTAEYARDKRPADTFFRGVVRVLSELSQAETVEVRRLIEWVLASTRRSRVTVLASDIQEGLGKTKRVPWFVKLRRDDPDSPNEPDSGNDAWINYTTPPQDAGRLFALLKSTGLGDEPSLGVLGAAVLVEFERVSAERLARVLRTSNG